MQETSNQSNTEHERAIGFEYSSYQSSKAIMFDEKIITNLHNK